MHYPCALIERWLAAGALHANIQGGEGMQASITHGGGAKGPCGGSVKCLGEATRCAHLVAEAMRQRQLGLASANKSRLQGSTVGCKRKKERKKIFPRAFAALLNARAKTCPLYFSGISSSPARICVADNGG